MKPVVITLCGSIRFKKEFEMEEDRLTKLGFIVLKPGCWEHLSDDEEGERMELKALLMYLHFRRIDMADRIHVINKGGYIGKSTLAEIKYAFDKGMPITKMETVMQIFKSEQKVPVLGTVVALVTCSDFWDVVYQSVTWRWSFLEDFELFYWIFCFPFVLMGIFSVILILYGILTGNLSWT